MVYQPLGYLVFRLKIGDADAWDYLKTNKNDSLIAATRSDLLNEDLPPSLLYPVVELTWKRAEDLIGKFQVRDDMSENQFFKEFLLGIARKIQVELTRIYHNIDSAQFVSLLHRPRTSEARYDYEWAWRYLINYYEGTLKHTIRVVLSNRMTYTDADVDDIWHLAYFKIQNSIHDFSSQFQGALLRWMNTYVQYEALNFYRTEITRRHADIETFEFRLGKSFDDPFDSERARQKELLQDYYDAILDIVLELPDNPASKDLSIDQQRRAIKSLFIDFNPPRFVAKAMTIEIRHINNITRVVKRRMRKDSNLAAHVSAS